MAFGDDKIKNELNLCIDKIKDNIIGSEYNQCLNDMHMANDEYSYTNVAGKFRGLRDYKDSKELANECRDKAIMCHKGEEMIEKEKLEEFDRKREKIKQQIIKFVKIGTSIVLILIVINFVYSNIIMPSVNYNKAMKLYEYAIDLYNKGDYNKAIEIFTLLDNFNDSNEMIKESQYEYAIDLYNKGDYNKAIEIFTSLDNFNDSNEMIKKSQYKNAIALYDEKKWKEAYEAFGNLGNYDDSIQKFKETFTKLVGDIEVGDKFTFGAYEQDNDTTSGKEKIEWLVLDKNENGVLIISDKALDCVKYNDSYVSVTWETCSLRRWLNDDFYNTAFSDGEKELINTTKVVAHKNPEYDTNPGNDTYDKIFLLSIDEVNKYFKSDEDRRCVPTAYAISSGAWTSDSNTKDGAKTCWWWLRSLGNYQEYASTVRSDGSVYLYGIIANYFSDCLRPTLWLNLDK